MKQNLIFIAIFLVLTIAVPFAAFRSPDLPPQPQDSISEPENVVSEAEYDADGFEVFDRSTGNVLTLSETEFLYGAVAAEMPPTFSDEALKAQAVACHSYYAEKRSESARIECDTENWLIYTDETHMRERWGTGFDDFFGKIKANVDAVADVRMTYYGEPVVAAYHAISGGRTEDSGVVWGTDLGYLSAVESPGDLQSPDYQTQVIITAEEFKKAVLDKYSEAGLSGTADKWVSAAEKSPSGTVTSLKIGETSLTGSMVRELFGLRSANFDVTYSDGKFVFDVRGYGHGVGMSQYGANEMAKQGADFREILQWYYHDVDIN